MKFVKPNILVFLLLILIVLIEYRGIKNYLTDIPVPSNSSYIIFENIYGKRPTRFINVLMPDETKSEFKIGRSHEADVRIDDISVTRYHAVLKYTEDGFYLSDNNSKFGTLSLCDKLELSPGMSAAVQVGRTLVQLEVHKFIPTPPKLPEPVAPISQDYNMKVEESPCSDENGEPMET